MKILNKIKELFMINNQRGVVLPIILMAIGGLSLIGAAAIGVSTGEIGIAHNDRNYKAALNMAEAGISDATDGIQANRNLLPRPLGAVNSPSYSFNVALGNTGRYSVTVSLPVVANIPGGVAVNASSVVVDSTTGLNAGDIVIIGDTSTHIMTRIGSIDQNTRTLYLMDNKGNPYVFSQTLGACYVAKNKLQVTSTGHAGLGLVGQYTTIGGWRTVSAVNGALNPTLSTAGALRSTVTLQGEYSMQEINVWGSLSAKVSPLGSKLNGPLFVTDAKGIELSPYNKGDYSGPIFAPTTVIASGGIKIGNPTAQSYYPSTNPNANYPKVIGVSAAAAAKADVQGALNAAALNAASCQTKCGQASATQQLYYLNGYQVDVKPFRPITSGNGLKITLDDEPVLSSDGTKLTFSFVLNETFYINSSDNVTVSFSTNPNPTGNDLNGTNIAVSAATVKYPNGGSAQADADASLVAIDPASTTDAGTFDTSNLSFTNNKWYTKNTTITVTVAVSALAFPGGYVRIYDNSNNATGLTTGSKQWSNGVWVTPLGSVEAQQKQGDVNWLFDAGAGTHTDPDTNHKHDTILTSEPTTQWRGIYATSDTASSSTTTWTSSGEKALLFGGRTKNSTAWVVGDTASYYTTYFIHTNAVGSCNDHDIKIVSYTKVTYLGRSTKCNDTDQKKLFLYETIWNHRGNSFNKGVQDDDNDLKLGYIPHKGYYKWVRSTDDTGSDADKLFKGVEVLMGDKEFNSVFNHPANTNGDFHSAVVNANIEKIRMIGWSNPPLVFNSTLNRMDVSPSSFATWYIPDTSKNWDWPDMVGTRSQFTTTVNSRGFDFTNFSTIFNAINLDKGYMEPYNRSGNLTLPDMSDIDNVTNTTSHAGTGNVDLYRTSTPATWPGTWSQYDNTSMPGNPLMDPNNLATTVITATISGPNFTTFEIKRGSANLFFDAANGIPFNIQELKIETKGAGASITMGTAANPATVFAGKFKLESEDCGGMINFNFTGKMVAKEVEFEKNVKYNIDGTLGGGNTCLSPALQSFIYLKKEGWKEVR